MIIVILGAGVDQKGRVSKETVNRLNEALAFYKKNKAPLFLAGRYNFVYNKNKPPSFTEAEIMKAYLLRKGVEEKDILLDKESNDTISAAYNLKTKILLPQKEKEVVVVTSDISIQRAEYVFYKVLGDDYSIMAVGSLTRLSCTTKGMIVGKERLLLEKARELLNDIKEGDHKTIKEKIISQDGEKGVDLRKLNNYKKTC
jgi:uncharacterized SAM-binding protein YcdF (DUF218 family)